MAKGIPLTMELIAVAQLVDDSTGEGIEFLRALCDVYNNDSAEGGSEGGKYHPANNPISHFATLYIDELGGAHEF